MLKILKFAAAAWLLFVLVSSFLGGGGFRSLGSIFTGVSRTVINMTADKADRLKAEADGYIDRMRDWRRDKTVSADKKT